MPGIIKFPTSEDGEHDQHDIGQENLILQGVELTYSHDLSFPLFATNLNNTEFCILARRIFDKHLEISNESSLGVMCQFTSREVFKYPQIITHWLTTDIPVKPNYHDKKHPTTLVYLECSPESNFSVAFAHGNSPKLSISYKVNYLNQIDRTVLTIPSLGETKDSYDKRTILNSQTYSFAHSLGLSIK